MYLGSLSLRTALITLFVPKLSDGSTGDVGGVMGMENF